MFSATTHNLKRKQGLLYESGGNNPQGGSRKLGEKEKIQVRWGYTGLSVLSTATTHYQKRKQGVLYESGGNNPRKAVENTLKWKKCKRTEVIPGCQYWVQQDDCFEAAGTDVDCHRLVPYVDLVHRRRRRAYLSLPAVPAPLSTAHTASNSLQLLVTYKISGIWSCMIQRLCILGP